MTPVFRLCDEYVRRLAALDPVVAGIDGVREPFAASTDYGPDGNAARAGLIAGTLAALEQAPVTSAPDRVAAAFLRERLTAEAYQGYAAMARYLREEYAPRAAEADAVGAERHAVAARLYLGADIDPVEAYAWGWDELSRIEAEMAAEARRVSSGASIDEANAILDETESVTGTDAYLAWLRERHDQAISRLNGNQFDIPVPLRTIEVVLAASSTVGGAYYTAPSEDLTRPGRTWWAVGRRERFHVWRELRGVFHEGVPGHHLQVGAAAVAGDTLSRFARTGFVSGHGEGWALYAERLADELGWYSEPGTRLGMLQGGVDS